MNDFLSFRKMISATLIRIIYVIGEIAIIIIGLASMYAPIGLVALPYLPGFLGFLAGLLIIILSSLMWRVICEAWIIIFSMHDMLASIEKAKKAV